ncbi:MAG TPA: hypothetical protein VEA39_00235, partial [Methylophilaceae bacterium]|nr:hypothetical protein [Methylophilaceae bacterium]
MAPAAEAVKGDAIDDKWTAFADDSGSLGIPRDQMPQIKAEHRGAMTNFLNARGIDHVQEEVPASSLKPTQAEFSQSKVDKAKGFEGGDRSILVSQDGHVLDGHHQWLARLENNKTVPVIRLNAPIQKLLQEVREFPSAKTSAGATVTPEKNERFERNRNVLQAWLPDMAWAERGGQIIRDNEGQVTGRTKWVPKDYDIEAIRKDLGNVSYTAMQKAVQKALDGKPLSKKEKFAVDALMDFAESMAPVTDAELETVSDELTMDEQEALALLMHDVEWDQLLADTAIDDNALVSISRKAQNAADEFERLLGTYYETELESQNETLPGETDSRGTGTRTESRYQPGTDEGGEDASRQEQPEGGSEGLASYTSQDLAARDQAKADQRKAHESASKKAEADSQVNNFVLTGSDRPADQAVARGARDLFDQPADGTSDRSLKNAKAPSSVPSHYESLSGLLSATERLLLSGADRAAGQSRGMWLTNAEYVAKDKFGDTTSIQELRKKYSVSRRQDIPKSFTGGDSVFGVALTKRRYIVGDNVPGVGEIKDIVDTPHGRQFEISGQWYNERVVDPDFEKLEDKPDRRTNTEHRKRVEQMSADEMRKALLVDDLTGLGNRRAYDESEKLPVQVSVDVDSLKWVNDNMGHESGDVMLKA